jgi:FAD/FMN-containing dehydrogenase
MGITDRGIETLREGVEGRVVAPGDADYDDVRRVFYVKADDRRPAAIVRVANEKDASTVVRFAAETGTELAVRCGGHSGAGLSTSDGGVVLDVRDLRTLEIDADGRTAWAGSGFTAADYTTATAERDRATGFGDTGSVGIAGITLGGGVGYLSRLHGLTIDSLLAAEIVTADGEIRLVDEEHDPDLFWAIRGGGGNFGVATRFRYALHELGQVYGGMLVLPATPEVVEGFLAAADSAPDELSTIANVMVAPLPFLPDEVQGSPIVMALMTYAGDPGDGERVMAPFRDLAAPLADMLRPMPYPEMYPPEDPDYRPDAAAVTGFMDSVGPAEAATILERLAESDASLRAVQLRALGRAIAHVPNDATAYPHRDRKIMVNVAAFVDEPSQRPEREAWVDTVFGELRQGAPAAYVNFLGEDGPARIREAYPGDTYERLARIKAEYDPENVFRLNQNVSPRATAS